MQADREMSTMSQAVQKPRPSDPEIYWTKASSLAPNSKLPILVYRNVLPTDQGQDGMQKLVEANHWRKGGIWGHIPRPHYHSNSHECYVPISGWAKCLYGVGPDDNPEDGVRFDMKLGDVAVHAAGVAHCHVESSEDYRYFGLYPEGSPHWDAVYRRLPESDRAAKAENAVSCPIPLYDPVYGRHGPLPKLWEEARKADQ